MSVSVGRFDATSEHNSARTVFCPGRNRKYATKCTTKFHQNKFLYHPCPSIATLLRNITNNIESYLLWSFFERSVAKNY
jgi:hypothetical protein